MPDQRLPAEQHDHHARRDEGAKHVRAQRLAFVERVPHRDRHTEQSDVEPGGRQRKPAGHESERNDEDRVAEREEQRRDDQVADHRPRLPRAEHRPQHRPQRRQRDHREHHPVAYAAAGRRRCPPSPRRRRRPPPPPRPAIDLARAAAPRVVRPRQLEQDCEPGDAGHRDEIDLDAAQHVQTADDPHGVQRHHRREARQTDRGQHEHRLAGVTGQQVQAQPPAEREDQRRQRSHDSSVACGTA